MTARVVDPVYVPFTIVTPTGTPIGAPLVTNLAVPRGTLIGVDLQIPPGHRGTTGLRFTLSGQQILPWSNVAAWIIGDDFLERFVTDVEVDTKLAAVTYNTGAFDHTHYLRLLVRQLTPSSGLPTVQLVSNDALSAAS